MSMRRGRWRRSLLPLRTLLVGDAERAVDMEIRHHLEEVTDRLVESGWEEAAARAEAERRFGDADLFRDRMVRATRAKERKMRWLGLVPSVWTDLRYAVRGLKRSPTFAVTVIVTLALGAGAAVSVFTVVDALLLRPLPYTNPDQLVTVNTARESGGYIAYLATAGKDELERAADPLGEFGLYTFGEMVRTDGTEPEALHALYVSPNLDEIVGVRAYVGRTFTAEDGVPGTNRVMLGHGYWQALGGQPSMVGSALNLGGRMYDVVGVLPPDFKFPVAGRAPKIWAAIPSDLSVGGQVLQSTHVVARMHDGVTVEAAQARMDAIAETMDREMPRAEGSWRVVLDPVGRWRGNADLVRGVWLLAAAVLLMLLVALVNGINLLLFRATDRARELAVRLAIGSGRARLMRQLVTEGMVLGLVSGVFAVLLAQAGVRGLAGMMPSDLAFSSVYTFRIETRVLVFALLVSVTCGAVLGLIPGLFSMRSTQRFDLLKGRGGTRRQGLLHNLLAASEIAVAMGLLTGAGMLSNSLIHLSKVDPGFDADRVAMMGLSLPQSRYANSAARAQVLDEIVARIRTNPEIRATIADGVPPHTGFNFDVALQAEGRDPIETDLGNNLLLPIIAAGPDYLDVLGGTLVAGRNFAAEDVGTRNVMIDEPLARALFGGNAIGQRFRIEADADWYTVAGIFRHMVMMGLDDRVAPYAIIRPRNPERASSYMSFAINAADPVAALAAVRQAVYDVDPELPIATLETARMALASTIDKPRFLATVMIALSTTAMLLAALGVYGVLSYSVTQRRREMGVRLAIGASASSVTRIFLRRGVLVALAGIAAGIVLGRALTGLSASLLFGVEPGDLLTTAAVALLMIATAVVACLAPARRATRVDPVEVLRAE